MRLLANSNNFAGTLPANLRGLEFLYEIDLSNNALSGPFPIQVLDGVLTFLDLRFNVSVYDFEYADTSTN